MKERSNNIVVSIVEGETSTRQMELDLNDYLATGWQCSAHAIGPGVFVVRFPNPRAVAQICYVGRIVLKTSGAVVNVTKWSSAIGSKGVMEVAWVKVSNVPLDKRSERNMAYVASLVGVPLEIDYATLHRPASARVKIGCRSVDEIPSVAEAVLGEHFYDFYFEVDQVLVRDPSRGESLLSADEKLVVPVDAERGECDAGKVEYMVESPDNAVEVEVIPTPPLATEENLRFSLRNVQSKMEDVQLKAAAVVKKRDAEGTLHSHNSFDALSNQNMMLAASKMGVIIPDNDFVNIDIIRELEKFRNNNSRVEREDVVEAEEDFNNMSLINANGVVTHLELGWMEEGNMEEDDFTIVRAKYFRRVDVTSISSKFSDSPIWKAIMKVKPYNMAGREVILRSGLLTGDDKLAMERGAKMLKMNASNMLRICAAPEDGC
ncbi:hypothetical protein D1007_61577 [Hordeum vulgare]|nr:hypothetical protein D1007_61577 [Hordeum vulgare]